jgi:uncharacterized OB-fold protein
VILQGNRCVECNLTYFPPRAICGECSETSLIDCGLGTTLVIANTEVLRGPGVSHEGPVRMELVLLSNGSLAIRRE